MSQQIELLASMKNQLVNFLDELIDSFPDETDFVIFRIFINDQMPIADIMEYIVVKLCPLHDMVKKRDEKFFLEHNIIFENFGDKEKARINYFKQLWLSGIDKQDKEIIWSWFDLFLSLAQKYKNLYT